MRTQHLLTLFGFAIPPGLTVPTDFNQSSAIKPRAPGLKAPPIQELFHISHTAQDKNAVGFCNHIFGPTRDSYGSGPLKDDWDKVWALNENIMGILRSWPPSDQDLRNLANAFFPIDLETRGLLELNNGLRNQMNRLIKVDTFTNVRNLMDRPPKRRPLLLCDASDWLYYAAPESAAVDEKGRSRLKPGSREKYSLREWKINQERVARFDDYWWFWFKLESFGMTNEYVMVDKKLHPPLPNGDPPFRINPGTRKREFCDQPTPPWFKMFSGREIYNGRETGEAVDFVLLCPHASPRFANDNGQLPPAIPRRMGEPPRLNDMGVNALTLYEIILQLANPNMVDTPVARCKRDKYGRVMNTAQDFPGDRNAWQIERGMIVGSAEEALYLALHDRSNPPTTTLDKHAALGSSGNYAWFSLAGFLQTRLGSDWSTGTERCLAEPRETTRLLAERVP